VPQLATLAQTTATFFYEDRGMLVTVYFNDKRAYASAGTMNPAVFGAAYNEQTDTLTTSDVAAKAAGNLAYQI